jgi:RHS repeat-associated protein
VASTTAYTQRYEYDLLGNIEQLRHIGASAFTRRFDYGSNATNYLQRVEVGGAELSNYAYDANGNVVRETQSRHLQWDAADQLRQFATWTGAGSAPTLLAYYLYDAGGQHTKKLTQTGATTWQVTVYADGAFEHRYEVSNGNQTGEQTLLHVLDGQSRLYQRRAGDALGDLRPAELYTLEDHLGSATATVDANGALVSREEYYPFDETSFGSHEKQRYRYCGKERDAESGLYYYGARYYAAWLCRFISVDPLSAKYA